MSTVASGSVRGVVTLADASDAWLQVTASLKVTDISNVPQAPPIRLVAVAHCVSAVALTLSLLVGVKDMAPVLLALTLNMKHIYCQMLPSSDGLFW